MWQNDSSFTPSCHSLHICFYILFCCGTYHHEHAETNFWHLSLLKQYALFVEKYNKCLVLQSKIKSAHLSL